MTSTMITFQCRECGQVIRVWIRDNKPLSFSILNKLYSEKQCLDKSRYFKCVECGNLDNTKKFENVFS